MNGKQKIFYDGDCPLCKVVIDTIDNSTAKEKFSKQPTQSGVLPPMLTTDAVQKEIHVISENGEVYKGSRAILKIIEQYPKLKVLSTMGNLPIISQIFSIGYKVIAAHRHFLFGPSSRIFWLKNILIIGFIISLLLSAKLWLTTRWYPLTPIFKSLPLIPYPWDHFIFYILLGLSVCALFFQRPRKYIILTTIVLGLLAMFDQSRWQPEFYEYFFLLIALSFFSWDFKDERGREKVLITSQLLIACIYIWGGLQKINPIFIEGTFPWMTQPIAHFLPSSLQTALLFSGIFVPFVEAGIGFALLTRKCRNMGIVGAVLMHLFILFSLSPIGHNWNNVVWPWQILMIAFVILLFWRNDTDFKKILTNGGFPFHIVIILLFGCMPALSFFGLWDSYLSFTLYSANTSSAYISFDQKNQDKLPLEIQKYSTSINKETSRLDISNWSFSELNVPPYPEERIFKNIGRYICSFDMGTTTQLFITGKPYLMTGAQKPEIYSCSDLGYNF